MPTQSRGHGTLNLSSLFFVSFVSLVLSAATLCLFSSFFSSVSSFVFPFCPLCLCGCSSIERSQRRGPHARSCRIPCSGTDCPPTSDAPHPPSALDCNPAT